MLNHYFILCRWALFTKEHYVLAHYKNKCISLCFLKDPWKSIGALLLFCCGGVHLKMQIRADQSEALKPEPCQPIRSSKTWATLSAVIPSYTEPPITSYFSDWSSFLYNLFGLRGLNRELQLQPAKFLFHANLALLKSTLVMILTLEVLLLLFKGILFARQLSGKRCIVASNLGWLKYTSMKQNFWW